MIYILLVWLLSPIWWPISLLRTWLRPKPQRILIAEIAGIGDVVCSTAVFSAVRTCYPNAHVALMVDSIAADLAPMLTTIDEVIVFRAVDQRGITGRLRLMRQIRSFDTFMCLIPSAAQLTAACWAAVPRRYTVLPDVSVASYAWLKPLMTHSLPHQSDTSFVGTQLQLLAPLGVKGKPDDRILHVTDTARYVADTIITSTSSYRWIGIAVGSGQGVKALDPKMLARLVEELLDDSRLGIVLIGGPKEFVLADELYSNISSKQRCINTVGQLALGNLPGLLMKLSVFVGVDSGVTYMADALGVPLVYIPGPVSPVDQGPIRSKRVNLSVPLDCAPCSRVFVTPKICKAGTQLCTRKFTDMDIVTATYKILSSD